MRWKASLLEVLDKVVVQVVHMVLAIYALAITLHTNQVVLLKRYTAMDLVPAAHIANFPMSAQHLHISTANETMTSKPMCSNFVHHTRLGAADSKDTGNRLWLR